MNFAKFLRIPFLIEHLRWLLLNTFLFATAANLLNPDISSPGSAKAGVGKLPGSSNPIESNCLQKNLT